MQEVCQKQEACRKDVERAFGVLQSRWAIVRHPARTWDTTRMHEVMTACVIMHNMIVEDEREDMIYDSDWLHGGELVSPASGAGSYEDFIHVHQEIRNRDKHNQLQADLIEHMWNYVGNQPNNPHD